MGDLSATGAPRSSVGADATTIGIRFSVSARNSSRFVRADRHLGNRYWSIKTTAATPWGNSSISGLRPRCPLLRAPSLVQKTCACNYFVSRETTSCTLRRERVVFDLPRRGDPLTSPSRPSRSGCIRLARPGRVIDRTPDLTMCWPSRRSFKLSSRIRTWVLLALLVPLLRRALQRASAVSAQRNPQSKTAAAFATPIPRCAQCSGATKAAPRTVPDPPPIDTPVIKSSNVSTFITPNDY